MSQKSMLNTGILVITLIILGKIAAFGKDIVVSAYFGAGSNTDAYFIALNITTMLFVAFYSTVNIVFLPMYNNQKIYFGRVAADKFSSNLMTIYSLVAFLIASISFYYSTEIVSLVSDRDKPERNELSVVLLQIMVVTFPFSVLVSFLTSIELNNKKYFTPHMIPIFNNAVVIFSVMIFGSMYGVYSLAIAGVAAWIIQAPLHVYFVKNYFIYSFTLNLFDQKIKKLWVLFIPAFLGVLVDNSNIMVDTMLASKLEDGSISALNYSMRLISFASGIFIVAIISISFPIFSKLIEKNDISALSLAIKSSLRILVIVMSFVSVVVFIFHQEIVSIVYQRGEFDLNATTRTSEVFYYYGLGLIFIALRELFNKIFYAYKNTKIPFIISVCSVGINILLSLYLVKSMGVNGLALATTLSLALYVFLQLIALSKFLDKRIYTSLPVFFLKILLAVFVSLFTMLMIKVNIKINNSLLSFLIPFMVGSLIYFFTLQLFKIDEVKLVFNKLQSVFHKIRV